MENNIKHTPGPWIIDDFSAKDVRSDVLWYNIKGRDKLTLAEVKGQHYDIPNSTARANANLIASAPDLLAALIEIYKGEGRYSTNQLEHASNTIEDMKQLAIEAIKKATS